jgi:hypothetical protein
MPPPHVLKGTVNRSQSPASLPPSPAGGQLPGTTKPFRSRK